MRDRDAISRHDDMGWPLCPLDALAADTARGFSLSHADGRKLDLIVWHQPQGLRGFINHCPHLGTVYLTAWPDAQPGNMRDK